MTKLKEQTHKYYDYFEMQKMVEKKLGYEIRDCGKHFHPNGVDFKSWYNMSNTKGIQIMKTFNTDVNLSEVREAYKEFELWLINKPEYIKYPYLDFWHWQIDHVFNNVQNDSFSKLNISLTTWDDGGD